MNTYPWACLACEETNAASALACGRCGCPAQATSAQVESARDAYRRRAGLPAVVAPDPVAVVMTLPLLPIGAAVFVLLGALMLIVDMGASTTAFGGLMIALAALCLSSWRPPRPAPG
ncbi:MAG: hypothetical protein ABI781_11125 [Burkholderiales bacterium]